MVKKSKASPAKKKTAKSASKKPARKVAAKKTVSKKKAVKKVAPKKAVKKATAPKKKTAVKKSKAQVRKATAVRTRKVSSLNEKIKKQSVAAPIEELQSNLPPVEEKSPSIAENTIPAPGMDKKSVQRAALRNYDNHHIQLSNRKGGIKPAGKKPLW